MPQQLVQEPPKHRNARSPLIDLSAISLGEPSAYRGLAMVPIFSHLDREPDYLTLRDALAAKSARVTEVSEGGTVGALRVINDSPRPVLILDGEELIGAKQNRIVNITIMVPAKTAMPIPVSCVEQRRWSYRSAEFADAPHMLYAAARAANVARVAEACDSGSRDADQQAVWAHVAAKSARMRTRSATGAVNDVYERHSERLAGYDSHIGSADGQVGAVFGFGDFAYGFDLFDSSSTLRTYMPKLVRGYALDAMERPESRRKRLPNTEFLLRDAQHLLDSAVHASAKRYKAVGTGQDVRFRAPNLHGAALVADGRSVHVTAFRQVAEPVHMDSVPDRIY